MIDRIHWLGHASFRLNGPPHQDGPIVYIDPWRIPEHAPSADLILISHDHHDHCSPQDIDRLRKSDTVIVGNSRVADVIGAGVEILRPYQGAIRVGDVAVRAVPAYTLEKVYHAQFYGGLGFVICMSRYDIYYAGDTDFIPEMTKIGCDIAILPVGGGTTMDWEQAAKAAELLKPRYVIPMHYGREIPGSQEDGRRFCMAVNSGIQAMELQAESNDVDIAYQEHQA